MNWKPVTIGENVPLLREKISQFAQILKDRAQNVDDIGLLDGRMGIALFLYYYSRFSGQEEWKDLGFTLLEGIFDQIETDEVPHTFCEGLAGIGWGLTHLISQGFVEADIDSILEELDQFSSDVMRRYIEDSNFDYLQGAVGIGLYFLERYPSPPAARSLQALLDALERQAVHGTDAFIHWDTLSDPADGTRGCNFSLSHGISGIVNLLARMARHEQFRSQAIPLMTGAGEYIMRQEFSVSGQNSLFPSFMSPKNPPTYSRLAWCYGDLGVALSLLQGAETTGDKAWYSTVEKIFLHSATRRDAQYTGVNDACVCHGSAGNAHIFNRAFQRFGKERLRDTAVYWLEESLKHAKYPDGYAGYKMRHPEIKGGWKPEADLLEGIAGLGLVFISAISDIEPLWDQCLMIS